jgi:arginine-tRNA-protein transferase
MNTGRDDQRIPLLLSMPQPCSYLENQASSSAFVDPDCEMDMALYSQLIRAGFRRSGRLVYRPHCPECQQCLSLRVPVQAFEERRRQRRIRQVNADVRLVSCNARLQADHYALYQRYTASRHAGGSMADSTPDEYMDFLSADWSETLFVEMREGERLLGVAVTDQVADGLSAVYTFFEPDLPQRSLGTFAVLSQISMARQLGLPYLYLGYWIRDCDKMAYKADFRPMQLFSDGRWRDFGPGDEIIVPELP